MEEGDRESGDPSPPPHPRCALAFPAESLREEGVL